jgi:hypothetical protein
MINVTFMNVRGMIMSEQTVSEQHTSFPAEICNLGRLHF